jgi:hypothetical protein
MHKISAHHHKSQMKDDDARSDEEGILRVVDVRVDSEIREDGDRTFHTEAPIHWER